MTYYGIYKITNLLNGKMYIGQHTTSNIDDGYMGSGKIIQQAIKKHGVDNFRKEWLMFCENEEELNYMERVYVDQTWINRSDTYNLILGGIGGVKFGQHRSDEIRKKISLSEKGKHVSIETRNKMSKSRKGKNHHLYGKHLSEETRRKISEAIKGKGKPHSEEHKRKISESCKGKHRSDEAKQNISKARKLYWSKRKRVKV